MIHVFLIFLTVYWLLRALLWLSRLLQPPEDPPLTRVDGRMVVRAAPKNSVTLPNALGGTMEVPLPILTSRPQNPTAN